jgi:phosphohistidine phosphatase SixA
VAAEHKHGAAGGRGAGTPLGTEGLHGSRSAHAIIAQVKIYLMRHCLTDPGEQMDAARTLNDIGIEQAHVMRKFLKAVHVKPDVIVCSDFARAHDTAKIIQRGDTPLKTTPLLQPDGDASKAWKAILKLAGDAKSVLIVTHAPLIYPLLEAVAFAFSDSRAWVYTHGAIAYCNPQSMPQFRWYVPPKLAAHIVEHKHPKEVEAPLGESADFQVREGSVYTEAGFEAWMALPEEKRLAWIQEAEARMRAASLSFSPKPDPTYLKLFGEGALAIAENLRRAHKAAVVEPLIDKLKRATQKRFRRQWRRVKLAMRKLKPRWDVVTYSEVRSNLQAAIVIHDPAYAKVFDAVTTAAKAAGRKHVTEQLSPPNVTAHTREAKIPFRMTIAAADLEDDLDNTTDRETGNKLRHAFADAAVPLGFAAVLGQLRDQFAQYADGVDGQTSRAESVAVTEVSGAYHDGGAEAAAEVDGAVLKSWDTEDDPCETCQANSDQGEIPEDGTFDSGDDEPPAHPNCRCSVSYRLADEG